MLAAAEMKIETNARIPTWFGIGGGADRLVRPRSVEDVRRCVEIDSRLRVLGDGANLLVDDDGVAELVVAMEQPSAETELGRVDVDHGSGLVRVGAGADFAKVINECVRRGLSGLEGLGGIPATIGGAVVMNAGGTFGQIADSVSKVFAVSREGRTITLDRAEIAFGYRRSGLNHLIITGVELRLKTVGESEKSALRDRLKEVMAYKKQSQPMAENSAGCCFKNPTLHATVESIGEAGKRVSAGMLIDRAGCKGLRIGGAEVSERHGNFLVTRPGATARDVIRLMEEVERRVMDAFGVRLEREVVVWRRTP